MHLTVTQNRLNTCNFTVFSAHLVGAQYHITVCRTEELQKASISDLFWSVLSVLPLNTFFEAFRSVTPFPLKNSLPFADIQDKQSHTHTHTRAQDHVGSSCVEVPITRHLSGFPLLRWENSRSFPVQYYNFPGAFGPVSYTHLTLPTNREV